MNIVPMSTIETGVQAIAETAERSFTVRGPSVSFQIALTDSFVIKISESVVIEWFVIIALGILFFILGRNLKVVPEGKRQVIAEFIVGFFNNSVRDTMGDRYKKYTSYFIKGCIFITYLINFSQAFFLANFLIFLCICILLFF